MAYPSWSYFPRNVRPPTWAIELVSVVGSNVETVDSRPLPVDGLDRLTSDYVLAKLRPDMEHLGYTVESGKSAHQKIRRPVLFGEDGEPAVSYEIDAFHDEIGIAVEVEAGRGSNGNADYRDIVRTSLLLDANYFALLMPISYHFTSGGKAQIVSGFANTRAQLNAIYASERLRLPFAGVLLLGY
jgi:hypothetical protein